jgi:hypothetical protein
MGKRSLDSFIRQNEAQNTSVQFTREANPTPENDFSDIMVLFHHDDLTPKKRPNILALTNQ